MAHASGRWHLALQLLAGLCHLPPALAQGSAAAPLQVGVVEMQRQSVPRILHLPGRAAAYDQAEIRPRVDGAIVDRLYTPGQELKAGDPMFRLDDASYAATLAADKAALALAEADLPLKQAAYDRAEKLRGSGYTDADVENAQSQLAASRATLESARAALRYSQTQLDWTTIRSPIDGVPDVANVTIGNLVLTGQSQPLTSVTTLDPIYVDMLEPSATILGVRRQIAQGTLSPADQISASLTFEDGSVYPISGSLVAQSATISETMGTRSFRFRFDNPDHRILPGMFLRGAVDLGTIEAFLVPQRAGSHGADGSLKIFVVGPDQKSRQLRLTTIGSHDNGWIVTDGLDAGMKVIVDNLKSMRAGMAVTPVAASIDAKGLTMDAKGAAPAGDAATAAAPAASDAAAQSSGAANGRTGAPDTGAAASGVAGGAPDPDAGPAGETAASPSGDADAAEGASAPASGAN